MAAPEQQRQHAQRQQGRAQQRGAPVGTPCHRGQEQRRQRPADIAADAVHREPVRQSLFRYALVKQGVVGRVEHAVAATGQEGPAHQLDVVLRRRQHHGGNAEQRHATHQHHPRAEAIDHETGHGLPHPGHGKEHRHQQTKLAVGQVELGFEPRYQRSQYQVIKVGSAVRQPHQADHLGVLPK